MNDDRIKSPHHNSIRTVLRVGGPVVFLIGLAFTATALINFFWAFGGAEPPRLFWCGFVGLPLIALGGAMCQFGYIGDVARFIAAETSPVAKDTTNYLGEGIQPGAKAVAKAVTEGILEAQQEHRANS